MQFRCLMTFLILSLLLNVSESFLTSSTSITTTTSLESTSLLLAKSGTKKKKVKDGTVCVNRQARRNFEILETLEAGIALKGTEVKR